MNAIGCEVFSSNIPTSSLLQAMEILMQLQQRAIDKIPTAVYIYNIANQSITYTSKSVLELLGYEDDAIKAIEANNTGCLLHPDDLELFSYHLPSLTTLAVGEVIKIDYRMRGADGKYHWLRSQETILPKSDRGDVGQILGISQNLSQYKPEMLLYSDFSKTVASISQMVQVAADDSVAIHVNRSLKEIPNYEGKEVSSNTALK